MGDRTTGMTFFDRQGGIPAAIGTEEGITAGIKSI